MTNINAVTDTNNTTTEVMPSTSSVVVLSSAISPQPSLSPETVNRSFWSVLVATVRAILVWAGRNFRPHVFLLQERLKEQGDRHKETVDGLRAQLRRAQDAHAQDLRSIDLRHQAELTRESERNKQIIALLTSQVEKLEHEVSRLNEKADLTNERLLARQGIAIDPREHQQSFRQAAMASRQPQEPRMPGFKKAIKQAEQRQIIEAQMRERARIAQLPLDQQQAEIMRGIMPDRLNPLINENDGNGLGFDFEAYKEEE